MGWTTANFESRELPGSAGIFAGAGKQGLSRQGCQRSQCRPCCGLLSISFLRPVILLVVVFGWNTLQAQSDWISRRGGGTAYHLGAVAFGEVNGDPVFVAVSGPAINNNILTPFALTSPDGINWTQREMDGTEPAVFNGIAFQDGRFVAVGWNSTGAVVAWSDDGGVTWTRQGGLFGGVLNDVAPGYDGTWVAVGGIGSPGAIANGAVLTSPAGDEDWTLTTVNVAVELQGVVNADDRTFSVGTQGFMFRSVQGGPWQQLPSVTADLLYDITARQRGDEFTFIAAGTNGRLLRSTDLGENWNVIQPAPTATILYDVAWNEDVFIGVGFGGLFVYSFDDGVTWTQQGPNFPPDNFYGAAHGAIDGGQGRFVAVGTLERIITSDAAAVPTGSVSASLSAANANWGSLGGSGQIQLNNSSASSVLASISSPTDWITVLNPQVEVPGNGSANALFQVAAYAGSQERTGSIHVTAGTNINLTVTQSGGPPAAPVIAVNRVDGYEITGNWNVVPGADGYRVEEETAPGTWTTVSTLSESETAFNAMNLDPWTEYFYRVIAFNGHGDSPPSSIFGGRTAPASPTGLNAQPESWSQITVTWNDVDGAGEYELQRREGTGDWILLTTFDPGLELYVDIGLTPDTEYAYRMRSRGEPPHQNQYSPFSAAQVVRTSPYIGQIHWGTGVTVSLPFERTGQPNLNDVAFGNGLYVAVGDRGGILSSNDGEAWSEEVSNTTAALRKIAYGGGEFVAVGEAGVILSSAGDGTWTVRSGGAFESPSGLAYGNGRFVVVSGTSDILMSADGIIWSTHAINGPSTARFIGFGNGEFLLSDADGAIWNSFDGIDWTQTRAGSPGDLLAQRHSFAWNRSVWVAGGIFSRFSTSSEGQVWTENTNAFSASYVDMAVNEGIFVAVSSGGLVLNGFMRSANGTDWEHTGIAPGLNAVAAGSLGFVAVGAGGYIAHSADGTVWNEVREAILPPPLPQLNEIDGDGDGGALVAVGTRAFGASTNDGILWYRDAVSGTWTNLSSILAPTVGLGGVTYMDGEFFVAGGDGENGLILRSADGLNWSQSVVPDSRAFQDVAFGEDRYVVLDIERIFHSADGDSWTEEGVSGQYPSANYRRILYVDGRFYARGINSNKGLHASADGLDWNGALEVLAGFPVFPQVDGFAVGRSFGRRAFVAFAQGVGGPFVFLSVDGFRWARRTIPTVGGRVAYGNGVFAVNFSDGLKASLDGVIWEDAPTGLFPTGIGFTDIKFLDGAFWAVGVDLTVHRFQVSANAIGQPITPDDFGATAERIDFDNLQAGAAVSSQFTMQGVRVRSADGSGVRVIDPMELNGVGAHSVPYTVEAEPDDFPLEIRFDSGRRKVGFYFGISNATGTIRVQLRAYDAGGSQMAEAVIEADAAEAMRLEHFIGVGVSQDRIDRVVLTAEGEFGVMFLDDLLIDPSQSEQPDVVGAVAPHRAALQSPETPVEERLEAINALIQLPSIAASEALQEAVSSDADLGVRERGVNGLVQLRDPNAIPALVELGLNTSESTLRQAAYQAVWALRRFFPMPDPPQITVEAVPPIVPGETFIVEARVQSPVDRAQVQVRFKGSKNLPIVTRNGIPDVFQGPMVAGQEVVLRAEYLAREVGQSMIPVEVRAGGNLVDATTFTGRLYVEVQAGGSVTRPTPFPEWGEATRHFVENADLGLQRARLNGISPAQNGERNRVITGTILYQDGNPGGMLAFTPVGNPKPARMIRVRVVDASDRDDVYGEEWTDSQGTFWVVAEDVSDNRDLEVVLEVDNHITKLYLDTDVGTEELLFTLAGFNVGSSGFIDIGTNVVPATYRKLTVDENGFALGGTETHPVSFAAALNVNEVIRVTRADMDANRDPNEGDSIGHVDVEYGDSGGTHYFSDLVLTAPLIDGAVHTNNPTGFDDAWVDSTVAHEYTHHLQYEIGSWDGHDGAHFFCTEIESFWWNASEFAFSEGMANYYGDFIAMTKPGMSPVRLNGLEAGCGLAGANTTFTSAPRSQEAWFNVEGHVAAFLWDLNDGWGQGNDAWDQVDGAAINGHRVIMQIFDHELDDGWSDNVFDDAPDLREFYRAWQDRFPGLNFAAGRPVMDPVLNYTGIVPGDDSSRPGDANRPFPVIESNPTVPNQSAARLRLPDGSGEIPQYDLPVAAPHVSGQPVLSIRRQWSFIDAEPGTFNPNADQLTVMLGFSNLGAVTMDVDNGGTGDFPASANWSANVMFTPNVGPWVTVTPMSGQFVSSGASQFAPLGIAFQDEMRDLPGNQRYTADIVLTYQTISQTETRLIRVLLDQWVGPDEDTDEDGLTNREERDLAQSNLSAFGCLDPRDSDSDDDGLSDGDEIAVYGTSPCNRDTDGDGMRDGLEALHACLDPLIADASLDPDMDGLTNEEELHTTFPSDPCDGDSDDDGALDGFDNCRLAFNPDQADLDQDGRGDVCDGDIDGDGCANLYDPNPEDIQDPDEACLARPTDPFLTRDGRLITEFDPRLGDPRLHVLLDGFRPNGPDSCGEVICPPPSVTVLDENGEIMNVFFADTFQYDQESGFASTTAWLPDLDADGVHDLAIGVPQARNGAGDVLIVSTLSGQELARIEGEVAGSGLGASMALLQLQELALGAPGSDEVSGAVYRVNLSDFSVSEPITAGTAGDGFGTALLAVKWDDTEVLLIGAPGRQERGALYAWQSEELLESIAEGTAAGDQFGAALARAGDLTQDGIPEMLVGAPGAGRSPGETIRRSDRPGFRLLQSALAEVGEVTLLSLTGQRIWSLAGAEANERFGAALAPLSFGNGPVFEFLVGAPGWRNRTGRVYLVTAEGEVPLIIPGEFENAELGRWVAAGPDYDGDGYPSLLTVEPGAFGPEAKPGRTTAYQTFARPALGEVRFMENEELEVTVHGRAGVNYRIEVSGDLRTWEVLKGVTSLNIVEKVRIETEANQKRQYYRLSTGPER